jgi:hypothetical protein
MLESGMFASIAELAEAEKINQSYLCRVLRLSLLAPDIVEGALNGTLSPELTLERAMKPVPTAWEWAKYFVTCALLVVTQVLSLRPFTSMTPRSGSWPLRGCQKLSQPLMGRILADAGMPAGNHIETRYQHRKPRAKPGPSPSRKKRAPPKRG